MKANESEVFNRVVNRTLYSKKVVLALTVAFVMVGSAFVVSMAALADPPQANVTLEGWTLLPQPPGSPKWTPGNVKGYSEGDVVPVKLTVGVNGDDHVSITIGFEWGYGTILDPQRRGFDVEVQYPWSGDPDPTERAFNNPKYYSGSPDQPDPPSGDNGPFSVGPAGGATILSQESLGPIADGSPNWKIWDEWKLEVDLDTSYEDVCLLAGGLLFETTDEQLGAAYFPGSSLHVRMILVDDKKSSEDISMNVEQIFSHPDVVLEKFNTPRMVVVGDTMKMKIMWENLAQADAQNLVLWDIIPTDDDGIPLLEYGLELGTEVGHMWSVQDGVSSPVVDVDPPEVKTVSIDLTDDDIDNPVDVLAWVWEDRGWIAKGTGQYDANPITVYFLEFDVTVIGWDLGVQTNYARLWYWDDHNLEPCYADAHSHFTIIKPGIEITKEEKNGLTCAAGVYWENIDPQTGDPIYYPGDTLTYVITVTNPSPDVAMDYNVYDAILAIEHGDPGTAPIMSGTLAPDTYASEEFDYVVKGDEPEPQQYGNKFRNTATVIADDEFKLGEKFTVSDYWDVDILHPDLSIKKTACSEVAAVGEEIRYTVEVENLGDATLEEFVIYDQMMTDPILYEATQENPDDDLSPHEILILESVNSGLPGHVYVPALAHIIVVEDVDPKTDLITNKVWIEAWDTQNHYLYREDSVSLTHVTPSIKITKTAVNDLDEEIFEIGLSGEVKYKIEVENTGDVGLWWFYWDTFAYPAWTSVEKASTIWTNIGSYKVDGCWAGELSETNDGVYCGQVPIAAPGQSGVVAMSTHDTFVGDEMYYEVDIFPHESYWRAGMLLRYDEASGSGYIVHLYEGGVVLFEMNGWMLSSMGSASMAIPSGAWTTLGVRVENDIDSFFDVYVDGGLVLSTSDVSPLPAGKIGLAVWDEGHNAVHVHFDNVLVTDLDGNVLLWDSFEMLEPEVTPPSMPAIPFPVSPALPGGLACLYQARLASEYLAPTETDVRYYTYEVQADDPDPLVNTVIVLGWITTDGTEQVVVQDPYYIVWDCDDASVRILGWIQGFVYHDYDLNDVEKEGTDSALDGWTVHLYDSTGTTLIDSVQTDGIGHFLFDYLPPGAYMLKVDIYSTDYFSTNPKDLSDPNGLWEDVSVIAGFGSRQDFGMAQYAHLQGYKWNDWNMNRNRDQALIDAVYVWEPLLDGWTIKCAGWEYDELVNGEPPPGVPAHHEQTLVTGAGGVPGWFDFAVKPGIWNIWEVMPVDNPATPDVDEGAWSQTFPTTPGTHSLVVIGEGSTISDKHFGNVPLTTIWGYKYYDKIGLNGVREEGDIDLADWVITLDDGNPSTPILKYTTSASVLGYFEFKGLKPGTYTLGEEEPVGQEDFWYMTTPGAQLHKTIVNPTVPGTKIHQDIGNMRLAKVWGYKFVDEYGGTQANPTYPNGIFDYPDEGGYAFWPIHWKLVGGTDVSTVSTMEDDDQTPEDEAGMYAIWLTPGDYEIWEDKEFLNTWEATTPWKVWLTIPAHPWGEPVIKRLDFGNTLPLSDPMVPFVLDSGWNLWSSPVRVEGLTAASLLKTIGPAGLLITGLDEAKAEYYSYMDGWDETLYDFPIVAGDGYYIYVTEEVSFALSGDAIGPSQVELLAGWNLVGYSSLTTMKASALLGMISGGNALLMTGLDDAEARYYSYMAGWDAAYDFTLSAGKAYFVWVDSPCVLVYA